MRPRTVQSFCLFALLLFFRDVQPLQRHDEPEGNPRSGESHYVLAAIQEAAERAGWWDDEMNLQAIDGEKLQ
jgi:hypothetical protein